LKFGSENHLNVLVTFQPFLWYSLDRKIWKKSCHYHIYRSVPD